MALVKQSILVFLFLSVLTGVTYPLMITGLAQVLFPYQANGSLLVDSQTGRLLGSKLIGQEFKSEKYFWGRPSATTPFPYNSGASSGSNLGPTNKELLELVKERAGKLRQAHGSSPIPADLVTASASGLDPDISVAAAEYQAERIAKARGMKPDEVRNLVEKHTSNRQIGFLGEERVNVVMINLALDRIGQ